MAEVLDFKKEVEGGKFTIRLTSLGCSVIGFNSSYSTIGFLIHFESTDVDLRRNCSCNCGIPRRLESAGARIAATVPVRS